MAHGPAATAVIVSLAIAGCAGGVSRPPSAAIQACAGTWRLADGRGVVATPVEAGLRWRTLEGEAGRLIPDATGWRATHGWTEAPAQVSMRFSCPGGLSEFDGEAAGPVATTAVETTFPGSGGVRLAGRLILPSGAAPVPIIVQVHGSERHSARVFDPFQQLMPLQGVGVFVYDKRGTGGSGGAYTQDFQVLAGDAAAAVAEARRLAGPRAARLGLHGASQGGWVAPLAAMEAAPDFIIVSYGLIESPLEENRAETVLGVAEAGYGPEAQAAAGELADAAGEVMASNFREGYDRLATLRRKHRDAAWLGAARGEFTGDLVRWPSLLLRLFGPMGSRGTSWRHEGEPVLRRLEAPVLWILAGADREAPPAHTRARLLALIGEGRPITMVEFPDADHGMLEFETAADGSRLWTRQAPGYHRLVADFARGDPIERGDYGRARHTALSTGPGGPE